MRTSFISYPINFSKQRLFFKEDLEDILEKDLFKKEEIKTEVKKKKPQTKQKSNSKKKLHLKRHLILVTKPRVKSQLKNK